MVEVTYHCPYCGAVTSVEREGYLHDKCVSREPLDGWTYASTTDSFEDADGIEFVCLGDGSPGETPANGSSRPDVHTDGPPRDDAHTGASDPDDWGGANDPNPEKDGCGQTFYLSFLKFEDGEAVDHRTPNIDRPRFDFRP